MGHVSLTKSLLRWFVIHMLGFDITYLCTKFENSYLQPCQRHGWCSPKFKWFMRHDQTPLRDGLFTVGYHLLWSTCLSTLKFIPLSTTKIWKAIQYVGNRVASLRTRMRTAEQWYILLRSSVVQCT